MWLQGSQVDTGYSHCVNNRLPCPCLGGGMRPLLRISSITALIVVLAPLIFSLCSAPCPLGLSHNRLMEESMPNTCYRPSRPFEAGERRLQGPRPCWKSDRGRAHECHWEMQIADVPYPGSTHTAHQEAHRAQHGGQAVGHEMGRLSITYSFMRVRRCVAAPALAGGARKTAWWVSSSGSQRWPSALDCSRAFG